MSNPHLCDPNDNNKLFKILRVLEICRNKFTSVYHPTQDISVHLISFFDEISWPHDSKNSILANV